MGEAATPTPSGLIKINVDSTPDIAIKIIIFLWVFERTQNALYGISNAGITLGHHFELPDLGAKIKNASTDGYYIRNHYDSIPRAAYGHVNELVSQMDDSQKKNLYYIDRRSSDRPTLRPQRPCAANIPNPNSSHIYGKLDA